VLEFIRVLQLNAELLVEQAEKVPPIVWLVGGRAGLSRRPLFKDEPTAIVECDLV
jgi:hypothetical protein